MVRGERTEMMVLPRLQLEKIYIPKINIVALQQATGEFMEKYKEYKKRTRIKIQDDVN